MLDITEYKRQRTVPFPRRDEHIEPCLVFMEMDLHNNELGRKIALEYAGQGYDVFSQKIQEAINNGEAVIIWDPNVE